jgi:chromosome segregation ATPase
MPYTRIISLVPDGEHFDASAIGEGVWLSTGHLNSIENSLEQNGAAFETSEATIKTLNEEMAIANTALETAVSELGEKNTTIQTQSARITELEAQVAALGKAPSGSGSTLVVDKDETVDKAAVPSYLDESNPANQYADKRISKKK